MKSLMAKHGIHFNANTQSPPPQVKAVLQTPCFFKGTEEKILPTESAPLISSFIAGITFCIFYIQGLISLKQVFTESLTQITLI